MDLFFPDGYQDLEDHRPDSGHCFTYPNLTCMHIIPYSEMMCSGVPCFRPYLLHVPSSVCLFNSRRDLCPITHLSWPDTTTICAVGFCTSLVTCRLIISLIQSFPTCTVLCLSSFLFRDKFNPFLLARTIQEYPSCAPLSTCAPSPVLASL